MIRLFGIFLLCISYSAFSQKAFFSEPKKISSKSPQFRILGKNNEGIILHEYGKTENVIEAYTNSMKLKWRKTINVRQASAIIKKIVVYPDTTNIIYTAPEKENWKIYAQGMDAKFSSGYKFMVLDSVSNKINLDELLKVIHSKNRSKIVAFYPIPDQNSIYFIMLDKNLEVLFHKQVDFTLRPDGDYSLNDVLVDDEGNILVALIDNAKSKKSDSGNDRNRVFLIKPEDGLAVSLDFNFSKAGFGKTKFEIDNVNKQVVAAGFFTDENYKQAKGYFFKAYSLEQQTLTKNYNNNFGSNIYSELAGKESGQNLEGLSTFEITDLVLLYDGGVLVLAESRYNNVENIQTPSFVPAAGPSFRSVTINYYNDIMALCISPEGKETWAKVMRKKQVSEEDDGFFSSYALHIRGGELNFIYNEDIYQSASVINYNVTAEGQVKRASIFNSNDQNVLLVPRLGKQVSSNETIIPSFRKNNLRLVKLTY
jgi:hypothetical protein